MTDNEPNPPVKEYDQSIDLQPDYDDYGLREQENATIIIRIDHDSNAFEHIGMVESQPTGVVLKEHSRLTDDVADDTTEAYQPIQFISARSDEFGLRLQDAIFEFVHDGKLSQETAEELADKLTESISNQYSDGSLNL